MIQEETEDFANTVQTMSKLGGHPIMPNNIRVAIVTGAASGIGRAIAIAFADLSHWCLFTREFINHVKDRLNSISTEI
jgi:NADP-dependent 3-hydroxy acid dehydrogenase YdfG